MALRNFGILLYCSQQIVQDNMSSVPKFLGKSVIFPLLNGPDVLPSASDKAKFFVKNFSKNPNLEDSGISVPDLPSRTNLELHNISFNSQDG